MPTPTYTPLANVTLSTPQSTVTFSSISQAYKDLVLVLTATTSSGASAIQARANGSSSTIYNNVDIYGTGSSTGSGAASSLTSLNFNYQANNLRQTPNLIIADFLDYSATDKHKTVISKSINAGNYVEYSINRWASTAAIDSIAVINSNGLNYAAGSSFALYGVVA